TLRVPATVDEARVLIVGPAHGCAARWSVEGDGVPTDVVIEGCPGAVADAVHDAAMQWRFEPLSGDLAGRAFTFSGTVPVVPPPLGLDPAPAASLPSPPAWDVDPVLDRARKPGTPAALRKALADADRRFAWEPCRLQVLVDADGRVTATAPLACPAILVPAADRVARKHRYVPATTAGQPVDSLAELQLTFAELP
ncbi:MAG: hypothetical protein D6798_06165, partial [Deltaproteobacteria bacterium]